LEVIIYPEAFFDEPFRTYQLSVAMMLVIFEESFIIFTVHEDESAIPVTFIVQLYAFIEETFMPFFAT